MKKVFFLIIFSALIVFLSFPSLASAQTVGTHFVNYDEYTGPRARLRENYGGNATVTVLISLGCVVDPSCLSRRKANLTEAGVTTPILRIGDSDGATEKAIPPAQAAVAANAIASVFSGAIVEFGNEVNNINFGWVGGTPDSYGDALVSFTAAAAGRFRVVPAALDPLFNGSPGMSADQFIQTVYAPRAGSLSSISGLAFNAYQAGDWGSPCPENPTSSQRNTRCSWLWLNGVYESAGLGRSMKILTEYSLLPGQDGDLSQVIKFIDDTKGEMGNRGITYITPLVRNTCGAIDGQNTWDWLMFVNGSPSRIIEPNVGTDISSNSCSAGVGAGECEVLSSDGGGLFDTVAGIFSGFLSSITNALVKNPDIVCTEAVENLAVLDPADRGRYIKRPVDCGDPELTEGVSYVAELKHNFSWFGAIFALLFGDEERGSEYGSEYDGVFNLVADTSSGPANQEDLLARNNLRDYLGGANMDAKTKEEVLNCAVTDSCSDYKAYNYAGAQDKLAFRMSKNVNGEWKKTRDARRDEVLCSVISGYAKDPQLLGKRGQVEPSFEVTAGYIHQVPGTDATWVTAVPFTDVNRPLFGIEFVCTNASFACPGLSRGDINGICGSVMGPDFANGEISPGSLLAVQQHLTPAQLALKTPSELCLYGSKTLGGCAAFHLLPDAINQDKAGIIAEHVQKGAFDPDTLDTGEENETFRERPFSLPNGVKPLAERVFSVFAAPDQKKEAADPKPKLQTQCKNTYGVAGEVAAAFGGKVENKRYRFGFSPPQPQVGGLTISRGEVLQAADPIPAPSPNSQTETRTYVTTIKLPKDIARTQAMIGGETGYCTQLLPYDVARQMRTPIDGSVSPREFPQRADLGYTSSAISGDSAAPIPLLGGVLIAADKKNGICSELILPYSPNKQASTSRSIYALTKDKIAREELAKDPFAQLASFQALEQSVALRQISDYSED